MIKTTDGDVIGRYGRTPQAPQVKDYRTDAINHLINGDPDLGVAPNKEFQDIANRLGGFPNGVKNPQEPFYNVNRMGIDNPARQDVADLIQTPDMKQNINNVVGDKLSFDEIQSQSRVSPELNKTFTREQTADLGAQSLALRNKISEMAQMGLDDDQYKEAIVKDKAFGQYIARLLGQRRINSNPADTTVFNEMVGKILKTGADPDEVANAAKGVDFNDSKQAAEFYRKYIKATPSDWIDLLRYNSMLSSPNTHINNFMSNALGSFVIAPIEKTITGSLDFLSSKVTGKQQTQFAGEGGAYAVGYAKSLGDASSRFYKALKGEIGSTNLDMRDIPMASVGKRAKWETSLKSPMRLLEATDQFFTALTEGGETASLKLRQRKGIPISDSNIKTQAKDNAAYRLFRKDLGNPDEGYALRGIDEVANLIQRAKASKNPWLSNIAKFTLPFVRTPTNIL